jgi:hypothetical protein
MIWLRYPENELETLRAVFRKKQYILVAVCTAAIFFAIYALLLNYSLLYMTLVTGKYGLFLELLPALFTGYIQSTPYRSLVFNLGISLAIGLNFALVGYRLMELSSFGRENIGSVGGIVLAVVAPACPACATAVIASAGLASLFAVLPFNGAELKAVSLFLLLGSAFWITTQINKQYCDFC